jgi:ppGpp synthetase/RelA/SpoT-type nucleotidyltranferase
MWKKVEYTQSEINTAGEKVNDPSISVQERAEYLKVIDNWRAAHAFPMNTFAVNLKHQISGIPSAIAVQRLKRLDTILHKLQRFPNMKLYRMQDLGGCRVIVPDIKSVFAIRDKLKNSRIRHEEKRFTNYIEKPRNTGYRGIHIIYKYKSERTKYYDGLLIEIQIRTKLQHLWATAVETIGVFTQNGLKFNQGSDRWLRFFQLVSALFAFEEETTIVESVPPSIDMIIDELLSLMRELDVKKRLNTIQRTARKLTAAGKNRSAGFYLLALDVEKSALTVKKINGITKATEEYNKLENSNIDKKLDVVLVSTQRFDTLIHAYPNYFADIHDFSRVLHSLIAKHSDYSSSASS